MATDRVSKEGGLASRLVKAGKNVAKAAIVTGALLMPYAGSKEAKGEHITIRNYAPENSLTITGNSADLEYSSSVGVSNGYDTMDKELSMYLQSQTDKNFVVYFPLDNSGTIFNAETNFINHMHVGETYTAHLALSGNGISNVSNRIDFSGLDFSDNPNVNDLLYQLKVDKWGGNSFITIEEGLVGETSQTASWDQTVFPGQTLEGGRHYGELSLTAIGNPNNNTPEPLTSTLLVMGALSAGAAGLFRPKRKRGKSNKKALDEKCAELTNGEHTPFNTAL